MWQHGLNLPAGLKATVKTQVTAGGNAVTVKIAGTPTEAKSEAMVITIPKAELAAGKDIKVTK